MSDTLSASVGDGGINHPEDVKKVQILLKHHYPSVHIDMICGPHTIEAIRDFQKRFLKQADGVIDPNGLTWRKLAESIPPSFVALPMQGTGYYRYSESKRQYGTLRSIQTIEGVARLFHSKIPGVTLGIGDISFQRGEQMLPHHAHRRGLDIDIRPLRKDGKPILVYISDLQYSRERTKVLVEILLAQNNVHKILFNDGGIHGVHHYPGHDNHLHVEMKQ